MATPLAAGGDEGTGTIGRQPAECRRGRRAPGTRRRHSGPSSTPNASCCSSLTPSTTWGVLRVSLKTDARNERSRTAILRIGARLRGHPPRPCAGLRRRRARHRLLLDRRLRVAGGSRPPRGAARPVSRRSAPRAPGSRRLPRLSSTRRDAATAPEREAPRSRSGRGGPPHRRSPRTPQRARPPGAPGDSPLRAGNGRPRRASPGRHAVRPCGPAVAPGGDVPRSPCVPGPGARPAARRRRRAGELRLLALREHDEQVIGRREQLRRRASRPRSRAVEPFGDGAPAGFTRVANPGSPTSSRARSSAPVRRRSGRQRDLLRCAESRSAPAMLSTSSGGNSISTHRLAMVTSAGARRIGEDDDHRRRGRFLDRLQKRRSRSVDKMEIGEHEDLAASNPRRPLRKLGDLPRLVDEDRGAVPLDEHDIGMASRKDVVTRRAITASPVRADERRLRMPAPPRASPPRADR